MRLDDFNQSEVAQLNGLHGSPLSDNADVATLMRLVGGHPFLVRQALYTLTTIKWSLDELEKRAFDDNGPFEDHLRRQLWILRDRPLFIAALKQVLANRAIDRELEFQQLLAAGIVTGPSRQRVSFRCEVYRAFFAKHL